MKIDITNKHYLGKDPYKDWAIIFVTTCVLSVVLIIFGVFSYMRVGSLIQSGLSPAVVTGPKLDPNALQNAMKELDQREEKSEEIIKGNVKVGDPSI